MADRPLHRYRRAYALLLRLYPEPFRSRFSASMEQTFADLCRERTAEGKALGGFAVGLFAETLSAILAERIALMMPSRKNVGRLALITLTILAIPLVAMQFSEGVDWTVLDFVFAGALIFGTGMAFLCLANGARNSAYRAATGLGLLTGFLIVWISGAVGIIGSEDNPANLLYLFVLLVGAFGAALARLRPRGMAWAMFAAAFVHFLVPFVALLVWRPAIQGEEAVVDLIRVLLLNSTLALMFVVAGALYRQAAEEVAPTANGHVPTAG